MVKLVYTETTDISKTELILLVIAERAPVTEYDLYKHFPKYSHGTIHFCINKLATEGAITCNETKIKNRLTKQYGLTFIGTLSILSGTIPHPSELMGLSDNEKEERWKEFDAEAIIEFLCKQGNLLKYEIFEESEWLAEHYPRIAKVLSFIALKICEEPPDLYKNVFQFVAENEKKSKKHKPTPDNEWKSDETLFEHLQNAYRREFTRVFFESIPFLEHNDKSTTNQRLQHLVEDMIEGRKQEISALKQTSQLFQ
jgi:hypothetical protein